MPVCMTAKTVTGRGTGGLLFPRNLFLRQNIVGSFALERGGRGGAQRSDRNVLAKLVISAGYNFIFYVYRQTGNTEQNFT